MNGSIGEWFEPLVNGSIGERHRTVRDSDPRDSDPSQTASCMDYSLPIMSGRIYRGFSLQLIRPPTPETKAIYCSTMDGRDAQLVATVPGIELHIDSKTNMCWLISAQTLVYGPEMMSKHA